jgi:Helicase associated domain
MQSKLLASRLSEPKEILVERQRHSMPEGQSGNDSLAIVAAEDIAEAKAPVAKSLPASQVRTHASLESLAALISMEVGNRQQAHEANSFKEGLKNATVHPSSAFMHPSIFKFGGRAEQELTQGHHNSHVAFESHVASLNLQSALLAARRAEEQETLAAYLQQRQNANLGLQMEQFRRLQAASFLFGPGIGGPAPVASLQHLDSILAARQTQLASASELAQAQHLFQAQLLNGGIRPMPGPLSLISAVKSDFATVSNKRNIDAMIAKKVIEERPGEHGAVLKKPRSTLLQNPGALELDREKVATKDDDGDDDSLSGEGGERGGRRFRAYQFEQWTEKFQELNDFRQAKGHCQVPHTYKDNPSRK